jgi:hypothetical protein
MLCTDNRIPLKMSNGNWSAQVREDVQKKISNDTYRLFMGEKVMEKALT